MLNKQNSESFALKTSIDCRMFIFFICNKNPFNEWSYQDLLRCQASRDAKVLVNAQRPNKPLLTCYLTPSAAQQIRKIYRKIFLKDNFEFLKVKDKTKSTDM